jgi:hypothetical protein
MYYDLIYVEEKSYDEIIQDNNNLLFVLKDTKKGFTYTFDDLTMDNLLDFIFECKEESSDMVISQDQIKDKNKLYSKISSPYNIGILTAQLYQAYSLYENSNKLIRKFVISSPEKFKYVSSIQSINWEGTDYGLNIWDEDIIRAHENHCDYPMNVYNNVEYSELDDEDDKLSKKD